MLWTLGRARFTQILAGVLCYFPLTEHTLPAYTTWLGLLFAIVLATAGLKIFALRWRRRTLRLLATASTVVETARGPVECAQNGSGYPVLIFHGAMGGFDQSLLVESLLNGKTIALIAPSRPGYLRTPLKCGRTPEEQADLFAALLDSLGVRQAALIAISAGGPAARQFALRHPSRCSALLFLSAVAERQAHWDLRRPMVRRLAIWAMQSDTASWLFAQFVRLFPRRTAHWIVSLPERKMLTRPETVAALQRAIQTLFPFGARWAGLWNDGMQLLSLQDFPWEKIPQPALFVHGDSDSVVPFAGAVRAARSAPRAELLRVPGGSHFAVFIPNQKIKERIAGFLRTYTREKRI